MLAAVMKNKQLISNFGAQIMIKAKQLEAQLELIIKNRVPGNK